MHTKLSTEAAAKYVGVSRAFLDKLRMTGGGPSFLKIGKRVLYERAALDAWLNAKRMDQTPAVTRNTRHRRQAA
jgi:excisionase family DNA binding protein